MKLFSAFSILLSSISCYSMPRYKAELINYPEIKAQTVGDNDIFELKDPKILITIFFQKKKLNLMLTNGSDKDLSFLPLDLNLGTKDKRCSIKEIYEAPRKKIDFKDKYIIEKKSSKSFYYEFDCEKSSEAYLTINGLAQDSKKIILNFKFSAQ